MSLNSRINKILRNIYAPWGDSDLDDILAILAEKQVKATFFITGGWMKDYPEAVKKIAAAGHDLGNHGANHKHMSNLSLAENQDEIKKAHDMIKELTGVDMVLFRPPYGDYNDTVLDAAKACNYYTIQWDVDANDTK